MFAKQSVEASWKQDTLYVIISGYYKEYIIETYGDYKDYRVM